MRILIVYRYFAPDTPPYASMLGEMTRWFAEAGHEVEVITAQPMYKPNAGIPKQPWRETRVDGRLKIRRLWLLPEKGMGPAKVLNALLFITQAFLAVLFGARRDLVWTGSQPPVVQAWALSRAARMRGAKVLYHMQDIHPEIANIENGEMRTGLAHRVLKWLDSGALGRTDEAVVISPDMADVLRERGARPGKIRMLRNFALGDEDAATLLAEKTLPAEGQPLTFVFAGNIGRFQNLEALVAAFGRLDPAEAQLLMVGEGRAKAGLIRQVAEGGIHNVTFRDHMPEAEVFALLCQCHVGLVTLSPGLYRYAFPSKIWTYLAADLPMLVMAEEESNLTAFTRENGVGAALPWDAGTDRLTGVIAELAADVRAGRIRPAAKSDLYHRAAARQRWLDLLAEIGETGA
ncbi:MAG: glycosyltransferase family 4 protein [Pseudomonadota bacterium]